MSNEQKWNKDVSRRDLLKIGGTGAVALTIGSALTLPFSGEALAKNTSKPWHPKMGGYGPMVKDPGGVLDLPRGFQYRIISQEGDRLSDSRPIPGNFDGMAAFRGRHNSTILVRNHELTGDTENPVIGKNPYDKDNTGGTTALIVGANNKVMKEYVTSAGTIRNCAGGATPWGTWITCEETLEKGHGYAFEIDPNDPENKLSKTPIREMGAFSHEAVDVDPATGIVYLTEDGGPSFLYRYIPNDRTPRPGALQKGGTLQAAAMAEMPAAMAESFNTGKKYGIVWKDVDPEKPTDDAITNDCIRFDRLEGTHFVAGVLWFSDTSAGYSKGQKGRIYRYTPSTNKLELFYEASHANKMEMPDNIIVAPWGDLWFVEDGPGGDRIMGITPEGEVYQFGENRLNDSELAGPTFSTDGKTFFVNIQNPGLTFAIWGPFARGNHGRKHKMGHAAPPEHFAPNLSGKVIEAARAQGMTHLEAAAFQRHGIPLF